MSTSVVTSLRSLLRSHSPHRNRPFRCVWPGFVSPWTLWASRLLKNGNSGHLEMLFWGENMSLWGSFNQINFMCFFHRTAVFFNSVFNVVCLCVVSPAYWNGVPGCLGLAAGNNGFTVGGVGLGIPGLWCSPVLSRGESGGWPACGRWLDDVWLGERDSDVTGLRTDPPVFTKWAACRLGLLRWLLITPWWLLPSDWLPPTLSGQWVGPFRAILVSNWSQMGRVAGDWTDTVGRGLQSLLSFPRHPTDVVLLWRVLFELGGGGGGGLEEKDLCRWGAKGRGGGGPLLRSFSMEGGGTEGGGFLGSGLVGILCDGGMGGGGPLWKLELESWRSWNAEGTGGGG